MDELARSEHDESLRRVVAGMLSTIEIVPAKTHPDHMLPMADTVIRHIRVMDDQINASASVPTTRPEGPTEDPTRY